MDWTSAWRAARTAGSSALTNTCSKKALTGPCKAKRTAPRASAGSAAAASAAAALRDLASTLEQLAEARPSKQDLKKALAGYTQGLERLRVASQVEDQLLWLQQFDQVKGEQ